MPKFLCRQCGVQYPESAAPPPRCAICDEERQYVRFDGQAWLTLSELARELDPRVEDMGPRLTALGNTPAFAINQRAFLVQSPAGNVLWDCVSLIDQRMIAAVAARGGLSAIAISHPHYYTTVVEWSDAFGGVPIYIHAGDREWVQRSSPAIRFWEGAALAIHPEMTLVHCGGHFAGSAVMHWKGPPGGRPMLFSGDSALVCADRRWVSFMRSYPNHIPLNRRAVERIVAALEPYDFDVVHGAFWNMTVAEDGKAAVRRSAERYIRAIAD